MAYVVREGERAGMAGRLMIRRGCYANGKPVKKTRAHVRNFFKLSAIALYQFLARGNQCSCKSFTTEASYILVATAEAAMRLKKNANSPYQGSHDAESVMDAALRLVQHQTVGTPHEHSHGHTRCWHTRHLDDLSFHQNT